MLEAQAELDALKQDLAHEKMEKASAQADLEAIRSKKPDTSEADALRKELQALKDQHQAALMTAQQESAKATEEHLVTKASLEKVQAELSRQKQESESDYKDMNDSMTQLVEEANKKATNAEARLKEAEANLKVKDAELAEAQVCLPSWWKDQQLADTNISFIDQEYRPSLAEDHYHCQRACCKQICRRR